MSDLPEPADASSPEPVADDDNSHAVKPFLDHLEDLRRMLIKMVSTLLIGMILSFAFAKHLLAAIIWPLQRVTGDAKPFLRTLEVTGGFTLAMQLALYAGLALVTPLLLYYLAEFILPALTRKEKRLLTPAFLAGAMLFLAGAALAYFAVIPAGLKFFIDYNNHLGISSEWTINSYIAFVAHMVLAFGVCFELPLVVLLLAKLDLVTAAFLRAKRPYVLVLILIVAAVITPTTDPFNMAMLAVPMALLFEACIWITRWMEHKDRRAA
jgi:sec-independent protein translocase protein TatC